jgi:hypothetical protein
MAEFLREFKRGLFIEFGLGLGNLKGGLENQGIFLNWMLSRVWCDFVVGSLSELSLERRQSKGMLNL